MHTKKHEENFSKFDNPMRKKILPIEETIKQISIQESAVIADIGCGTGYYTLPISKILNSKVYAIDTSQIMLDELKRRADEKNINNIEYIYSMGDTLDIANESVDLVLICTVLHEIKDKKNFLLEAKRVLNNKGRLCIIEWQKEKRTLGPSNDHRIGIDEVKKHCEEIKLNFSEEIEISEEFYGVIFQKGL